MPFIDEVAYHSRDDLLSPEHGWRADVGFDWSFLEEFNVAGNAYVSRTKNEIFYNPLFPYMSYGYPGFGDNARHARGLRFEGELGTRQGRRRLARLQLRRRRV